MRQTSFLAELQRRNVHRAAIFYAGAAWLLVQIATQVFPFFHIEEWVVRWVVIVSIIGFPFAIAFSWFYEWTPQGIKLETEIDRSQSITPQTGKKLDKAIIAVLSVAVVMLLADKLALRERGDDSSEQSVAVLPLVNSTGDTGQEYFSDGVSEELISSLSRLQKLKVIGRTSSFKFKGKSDDSKVIGAALGVAYLLEGSVRKSGDRVRVAVELIKAIDGVSIWSDSYDRELNDIFAVQSEIATAVATQLKVALLGDNAETIKQPTAAVPSNQNLDAYNALLQGNYFLNQRTTADFVKAIAQYRVAIQIDRGYALAYAKLSIALVGLRDRESFDPSTRQAMAEEARNTADTAIRLDPSLSEAHRAEGTFQSEIALDLNAAESAFRRAAELAPNDPAILKDLANLKANLGAPEASAMLTKRAIALDPLNVGAYVNLAHHIIPLSRYDEAEAALRKALELRPQMAVAHSQLAILQILRGKPAEALALAQQEPEGIFKDYALALAQFANGDQATADAALQRLIHDDADDPCGSQIASVYALRNNPDQAFQWLQHALDTHDSGVIDMREDPFLLAYEDDPRFIAIAQKLGVMTEIEAANARSAETQAKPR